MSAQNFTQISERWFSKAKKYKSEKIEDVFDKFFTLFVAYNALYSEINHRQSPCTKSKDVGSATKKVPEYLGYSDLATTLRQKDETREAIDQVVRFVGTVFTIHEDDHKKKKDPKKTGHEKDNECIQNIKNGADEQFIESLLILIYKTRCNMFHGAKELHHIQKEILTPMNIILEHIIYLGLSKLHDDL